MTDRRYLAHFQPQAWVNDYAVDVDPEGDTTWDVTAFVGSLDAEIVAGWDAELDGDDDNFGVIDRDDLCRADPAAPMWVRQWAGPFTITLTRHEPGDAALAAFEPVTFTRGIYRTVIELEVFSDRPYEPRTLADVEYDIGDGDQIGTWRVVTASEPVPDAEVVAHLQRIGNDGTWFDPYDDSI